MSVLHIDFDRDVGQAVSDLGAKFTMERTSRTYDAVIEEIKSGQELEGVNGIRGTVNFLIVVQLSSFVTVGNRPVTGDKIIIANVTYRVLEIEPDPSDLVAGVSGAMTFFVGNVTA